MWKWWWGCILNWTRLSETSPPFCTPLWLQNIDCISNMDRKQQGTLYWFMISCIWLIFPNDQIVHFHKDFIHIGFLVQKYSVVSLLMYKTIPQRGNVVFSTKLQLQEKTYAILYVCHIWYRYIRPKHPFWTLLEYFDIFYVHSYIIW